jgi:hypothetical protein
MSRNMNELLRAKITANFKYLAADNKLTLISEFQFTEIN